jgi:hypothetical protein
MRFFAVSFALLLAACEGSFVSVGDKGREARIDKTSEARDACLAKNAAKDETMTSDPAIVAHTVALACAPETEKLVEASNLDGDPKVAEAIRQNSEFRAMGYVMKTRRQVIF